MGAQCLEYAKILYEHGMGEDKPPLIKATNDLFSNKDTIQGIKRFVIGKTQDTDALQAEYLKWGINILEPHINRIFKNVNEGGFPQSWITSVVIPLHKSGIINNPSNYWTIMVNPLLGKLFGSMVERKTSRWAKIEGKRAKGQAGFRPKYSTVDHGVTLRLLVVKLWNPLGAILLLFCELVKRF